MSRSERYNARDLTYSAEHRRALPRLYQRIGHRADACDRDWTEYCHFCWEPLGIFEEVRDRGQDLADKSTGVTERLAMRARLTAGLIAWQCDRPADIQAEIDRLHARLRQLEAMHPISGFVVRPLYPQRGPFEHITVAEHWRRIAQMHAAHESSCARVPRLERWRLAALRAKAQRQGELWADLSANRGDGKP